MQTPVCPSLSPPSVSFSVSLRKPVGGFPTLLSIRERCLQGQHGVQVCVCLGAKLSLIESGDVAQLGLSFCVSVDLLSAKVFNQETQAFI